MISRKIVTSVAFAGILAVASAADAAHHSKSLKGGELGSRAKVSLSEARYTAQKARPGMITDQELEIEAGGSGLRYSFDIRAKGRTFEVGVDAVTGSILENGAEGKTPD